MKIITITSQKQYDELPKSFTEPTRINITDDINTISHKENAVYYIYGDATIKYVSGNTTIQDVSGNATIQDVSGNAIIKVYSDTINIGNILMQSVIICIDCSPIIKNVAATATIIYKSAAKYSKNDIIAIYSDNMIDENHIKLYKSVRDDHTDFYSGSIKYEGIVTCPDWDDNPERECGGGLHLSPTPEFALRYNQGKVLECKVHIDDFVVYPHDITKVRCKSVEVI